MRVAIIGLGSIATKAYLPALTAVPGVTPVLVSRRRSTVDAVGERYRVGERFTSLDDAIATGLDAATVHAPTDVHEELVTALLRSRVPVLVDKPIAPDLAAATRVVTLATEAGVSLAVGFNRRYAPAYRALADWPDRDVVTLHRHRAAPSGTSRQMIYDGFIHVVDTLRFLVPSSLADLAISVRRGPDGTCRRVGVQFTGDDGRLAVGITSWAGGTAHELLDVVGDGRRRQVTDLADVVDFDGGERLVRGDGWRPATELRGIDAMCADFLSAVREGRRLDAADALATHEVCERITCGRRPRAARWPGGHATRTCRAARPGRRLPGRTVFLVWPFVRRTGCADRRPRPDDQPGPSRPTPSSRSWNGLTRPLTSAVGSDGRVRTCAGSVAVCAPAASRLARPSPRRRYGGVSDL